MTRSSFVFATLLVCALIPGALAAQDDTTARAIRAGAVVADTLPAGATHAFTVTAGAGQFVYGTVDQRAVNVRVTVRDPAGAVVRRFNSAARGEERFNFDTEAAGEYRIELDMPADSAGAYAVKLLRVEPIASDPAARVDQLMAAYSGEVPGAVVGVVRGGKLVFARGYGMANIAYDVPFTAETPTNIGSTSKQFTAFAIMLLKEQGKLSLDDDVREYIPELPDLGKTVTLRNLMTHTSGYREFVNTLALTGRRVLEADYIDRAEIISVVQRQPELQNDPGAEFNYNNTAFALLSMVVERVTDTPFKDWMRDNVFLPLGMKSTVVRATPNQIVEHRAQGYLPAPAGGFQETSDLGGSTGAGGIYTTVGDLARWVDNLQTGRLGGKAVVDAMTTPNVLTTGDTTQYGFGLFIDEFRGLRRVHHGGSDIAHRSTFMTFPEERAAVFVLSNNSTFSGGIPMEVAETFLGDALEAEPVRPATAAAAAQNGARPVSDDEQEEKWKPSAAELEAYAGVYLSKELETFYTLEVEDGKLVITQRRFDDVVLTPGAKPDTFSGGFPVADARFERGANGSITTLLVGNGRARGIRFERVN